MADRPILLREATWAETQDKVRLIPQYATLLNIRLTLVRTDAILSLAQFVNSGRLAFTEALYTQMIETGLPLFKPIVVRVGPLTRLVVPPVVEDHDGRLVLVDGTHRVWFARGRLMPTIEIVV